MAQTGPAIFTRRPHKYNVLCGNDQAIDKVRQDCWLAALGIYCHVINDPKTSSIKPLPFYCPHEPCTSSGIQKPYSGGSHTVSEHLWSPRGSLAASQARNTETGDSISKIASSFTYTWPAQPRKAGMGAAKIAKHRICKGLLVSPVPLRLFVCL